MFRGRYEHNVDAKGRLALPAAFRKVLAGQEASQLVVTRHLSSKCLVAYPLEEWRSFETKFAELPQFEPSVMLMRRLYVGSAMDCSLDRLGRLVLPPNLRGHAEIDRDVLWVGGMRTMEIWAPAAWEAQVEAQRDEVGPETLAKLAALGI